jgi:hypothetical protein
VAAGSFEVRLTGLAAAELDRLGPRRRGMLTSALDQHARAGPKPGLLAVWTPADVAACEVLAETLLVYAIRSLADLELALFGPQLERRFTRLAVQRLLHRG